MAPIARLAAGIVLVMETAGRRRARCHTLRAGALRGKQCPRALQLHCRTRRRPGAGNCWMMLFQPRVPDICCPLPGSSGAERLGGDRSNSPVRSPVPGVPVLPSCRYCWEAADEAPGGDVLLHTCNCSGSLAGVHVRCLLEWQRRASNPGTCSTCTSAVAVPAGAALAVRLQPLWQERLQRRAELLWRHPATTTFW